MTDADIIDHNVSELLKPDATEVFGMKCRRVSCGSFSLCQKAKLKLLHGADEVDIFEVLAYFYIHTNDLTDCRRLLFDKSEGEDDGVSIAFKEAVYSWGDTLNILDIEQAIKVIVSMMEDATKGMVETDDKLSATKEKKTTEEESCPAP